MTTGAVSEKATLRCGLLQKLLFYVRYLANNFLGWIIFILTPRHVRIRKFHWSLLLRNTVTDTLLTHVYARMLRIMQALLFFYVHRQKGGQEYPRPVQKIVFVCASFFEGSWFI